MLITILNIMAGSIVCHVQDLLPSESDERTGDSLQEERRMRETARVSVFVWRALGISPCNLIMLAFFFQTGPTLRSPAISVNVRGVDWLGSSLSA